MNFSAIALLIFSNFFRLNISLRILCYSKYIDFIFRESIMPKVRRTPNYKSQPKQAPTHDSSANPRFKQFLLFMIVSLLASGGYFLTRETNSDLSKSDLFKEEGNFADDLHIADELHILDNLLYSKCGIDNDLIDCVQQVCDEVYKDITPLNRAAVFLSAINDDNHVIFLGTPEKDPKQPGSANAAKVLKNVEKVAGDTDLGVVKKFTDKGLTDEQMDFLNNLNYLVHNSHIPKCGGMAAQVSGRLIAQPLIQKSQAEIASKSLDSIGTHNQHSIVEVTTPGKPLIVCDSWLKHPMKDASRVCVMESGKLDSTCAIYQPHFWKIDKDRSLKLKMPSVANLPPKTRTLYRHETRMLLTQLNKKRSEAQQIYQNLTQPVVKSTKKLRH